MNNLSTNNSKELIFKSAFSFFNNPFKDIDLKDIKKAKEILSEIEQWEIKYSGREYSTLKNSSILTAYLSYQFGQSLQFSKKELSNVYISGLVHNIGKLYISDNFEESFRLYSSPLKPGEKGFSKISKAFKNFPQLTKEYLEKNTKFNIEIVETATTYHSIHSRLFKHGYPNIDSNISKLDTVLWFANSLSAISFSSIQGLERNYNKGKNIDIFQGIELLREQTEDKLPAFWNKASGATLASLFFTLGMGLSVPNKAKASNYDSNEVIQLVNNYRKEQGLAMLQSDEKLNFAAQEKAKDMLTKDYWDHFGPNGESPWQFISESGYQYSFAGENLAKGFTDAQKMNDSWLNSPKHKDNIVNSEFENIGVAVIDGNLEGSDVTLVVQIFAGKSQNPIKHTYEHIIESLTHLIQRIKESLKNK